MWLIDDGIPDPALPAQLGVPEDYILIPKEYDPVFLEDLPAPRPKPRTGEDPFQFPSGFFTFDDAFEDLMHAHFNGEVMYIRKLANLRTRLQYLYPKGETALCQAYRMWSENRNFRIWRYNSILRNDALAHPLPTREDFLRSGRAHPIFKNGWDLTPQGGIEGPHGNVVSPNMPMPAHETELAEATAERSSHSGWPSPFDILRSLVGSGSQDREPARTMSYSRSVRVTIDENGRTEERMTEHTDEEGRQVREVLVRNLDAEGNVISETTRQFEDGQEMEKRGKDVYNEL